MAQYIYPTQLQSDWERERKRELRLKYSDLRQYFERRRIMNKQFTFIEDHIRLNADNYVISPLWKAEKKRLRDPLLLQQYK